MNNKKLVATLLSLTIIFTVMGGTLAFWTWNSTTNTSLAFTITKDFSCSADGGEPMTSEDISLIPVDVEKFPDKCAGDVENVLKRKITVSANIEKTGLTIGTDLWLNVNAIDQTLANKNLRYAITTNENSCTTDIVSEGTFKNTANNSRVSLLNNIAFSQDNLTSKTYYLYIWLDAAETNNYTQNSSFDFSLGGQCSDASQVNKPELATGMLPVKISDDGTVTTVSEDDPSWYDYSNKKWANIVLVDSTAQMDEYFENPNMEVPETYILAYYVWIPRYRYKMSSSSVACSNIPDVNPTDYPDCYYANLKVSESEFLKRVEEWDPDAVLGNPDEYYDSLINAVNNKKIIFMTEVGANYNITEFLKPSQYELILQSDKIISSGKKEMPIDIEFESASMEMSLGDAKTQYRTHPAFWWDDDNDNVVDSNEMLSGIWVGKFETTDEYDMSPDVYEPTILPTHLSVTGRTLSEQFKISQAFATEAVYGLLFSEIDSHMMKNSEWGAVAYLSHSKYGINKEIRINNSSVYTGCGALTANASSTTGCPNAFGTVSTYPQSTTGNISGVFDMSGGKQEYVMGHYGDTIGSMDKSGFTSMPEKKYYDLYSPTDFPGTASENLSYCTIDTCGGHALNETAGWYGDNQSGGFVSSEGKDWFFRGGLYSNGTTSGAFYFNDHFGTAFDTYGFRSVIVTGYGA
ncbi:MAG: hypothetical protein IJE89_00970 [Bacilli bacterium]|nr:hypothetical protein [Bacilli bacterium]